MAKDKEFENILDECLDRLIKGETIASCLARHPEYAAELEPLLRTALETRTAAAVKPRPEFRQRAGYEFQAAIREVQPQRARGFFRWQARWMVPVAIVLVLVLGGGGTVMASAGALPDSPLYPVKLATEAVQLAFTFSDLDKAELYARFTDRRVDEIVRIAEKGKSDQIEKITDRLDSQLVAMVNLTSKGEAVTEEAGMVALQAPAATTAPPTTPSATEAPAALNAPTPDVTTTPTTTEAPTPVTRSAQVTNESAGPQKVSGVGNENKPDKQQKLKTVLSEKQARNLQSLNDELENAPASLKPALLRAIEIAQRGYEQAIANLE
jgi:hypothetical protein